jgi:hypothetical protein
MVWSHVTIWSSGQGCGDADLRGKGLMNRAALGDVQQPLPLGVVEVAGQLDAAIDMVDPAAAGFAVRRSHLHEFASAAASLGHARAASSCGQRTSAPSWTYTHRARQVIDRRVLARCRCRSAVARRPRAGGARRRSASCNRRHLSPSRSPCPQTTRHRGRSRPVLSYVTLPGGWIADHDFRPKRPT